MTQQQTTDRRWIYLLAFSIALALWAFSGGWVTAAPAESQDEGTVFKPSEEISEDFAVPFPADI